MLFQQPAKSALVSLFIGVAIFAAAGCEQPEILKLHYLNGFVPGSHGVFYPARIAIARVSGNAASGTYRVGAVYAADGSTGRNLAVSEAGATIQHAIAAGLADAGLLPVPLDNAPGPSALPSGVDFMLSCQVQEISCVKRFGREETVHGQYFTMTSRVKLKFALVDRHGARLYEGEIVGLEEEPPTPVGGEVFLPLETEPEESVSVALSRSIGALLIQPSLQRALPLRTTAAAPSAAPSATPSPSPAVR